MTVRSGQKCSALSRRRDPLGFLEKMLLESSEWNSTLCFLTWRESATPAGRLLFQLAPWTQSIEETESGLSGMIPTPTAAMEAPNLGSNKKEFPRSLIEYAQSMWPTPKAQNAQTPGIHGQGGIGLQEAVQMWPTPRKSDYKGSGPVGSKSHIHMEDRDYLCAVVGPTKKSGSLNPAWVEEWLMGYPKGWSDLKR